ncbi:MAG: hypothetical protein DRH49_06065 [Candidatus Coatesbacteria bacterium]|nr:MAG: hypothetical protein DRH49_06065 [Candidatus Coatesbacteria bacterium]
MNNRVTVHQPNSQAPFVARCSLCNKDLREHDLIVRGGKIYCIECAEKYTTPSEVGKPKPYILWVLIGTSVLLAVVGVVIAVVSITPFLEGGLMGSANRVRLKEVEGKLNEMYMDIGRYPSVEEGLELLTDDDPLDTGEGVKNWYGPYIPIGDENAISDVFGKRLVYGETGGSYYIQSLGKNGKIDYIPINPYDKPPPDVDDNILWLKPPEKEKKENSEEPQEFGDPVVRGGWW